MLLGKELKDWYRIEDQTNVFSSNRDGDNTEKK